MKNFLQNLLVFLAVCLCALIAFQWVREVRLRREIQDLAGAARDRAETIRGLELKVKDYGEEIKRLDELKNRFGVMVKSNNTQVSNLTVAVEQATRELYRSRVGMLNYSNGLVAANSSIERQNEVIRRQNEQLLKLAEDRNFAVSNYNRVAGEFSALAQRWNKQQEALAAAATNAANHKGR